MNQNSNPHQQLAAQVGKFTHDPLGFVRFIFPWGVVGTELEHHKPRKWQADVLNDIGYTLKNNKSKGLFEVIAQAVASGHGPGKSALVSWILLWALSTREDTRGIVTASTDTQLRTKTWAELSKWHRMAGNRAWFTLTATALYSAIPGRDRTWRIDSIPWSEHSSESFAGLHNQGKRVLLVFDEASSIADSIWEVSEGALTDADTEIIWCAFGNPTRNTGRFKECFGSLRHRWKTWCIDSRTVEGTNKQQFDKWIADYGEDSDFVRIRVKGEFPRAGSNQFIGSDLIETALARRPELNAYKQSPRVIGVDVARHGDDQTVIWQRQGIKTEKITRLRVADLMQIAARIIEIIIAWKPNAVFIDSTGIGWGVVDRLKQLGYGKIVYAVQTGEKAQDEAAYYNGRAEIWGRMRDWIKECGCLIDDRELIADLTAPEYGFDNRGRLQIERKDDMKGRGLASPDSADALALTFWAHVSMRTEDDSPVFLERIKHLQHPTKRRSPMTA